VLINNASCLTPLARDRGNAGEKSGLGERWSFRKLGDLLTPPAREAPVRFLNIQNTGIEMDLKWKFDQSSIDWEELSQLYFIAPLGDKPHEKLKVVFTNSKFKCFVFDKSKLIAVGRDLADGLDCSYICDVAVHPEYQGKGLGKQIVQSLIEQ